MRLFRQHKPDSLVLLFLFVGVGMLVTSFAHAENYLFGEPGVLSPVAGIASQKQVEFQSEQLSADQNSWLLPGSVGTRTTFKKGMAHIQFDSGDDGDVSSLLPVNTRFTFSMGLEDNETSTLPGSASHLDTQEWYDRYKPSLYFSIGHRW